MPGTAVDTTSSAPELLRRRPMRFSPWSSEVLDERVVGSEGPRPEPGAQLGLLVGEGGLVEAGREPRLALDLDDQDLHARSRCCNGERGGYRRLPHSALARDDHHPGGRAQALEVHAPRCYGSPDRAPSPARCRVRRPRARAVHRGRRCVHVGRRRGRSARPARDRRRAGGGLLRPAERVARPRLDQGCERTRFDAARAPGEVVGCDRRRRRRHRAGHRPVRRARRGLGRAVRRRCEGRDHGAARGCAPRLHLDRF